jgi:hypothetical protein
VIEIACARCSRNIDEYEQVTIVYNVSTGDPSAIHESCGLPDDVKGVVLHHKDMTNDDMVLLYYNMITYAEQRNQLQKDYIAMEAQYRGMLEYARERNRVIELLQNELRVMYAKIGEITVRMNPDMSFLTETPDATTQGS